MVCKKVLYVWNKNNIKVAIVINNKTFINPIIFDHVKISLYEIFALKNICIFIIYFIKN